MKNAYMIDSSHENRLRKSGLNSTVLMAVLSFFTLLSCLQAVPAEAVVQEKDAIVAINLGYGYRQDEFDWNIAGTTEGTDPNILSELTWEDLVIHQVSLGARTLTIKGFFLRGTFDYGWIVDGENQDSDYSEDDRQDAFSRSNNQSDKGNTLDFSVGAGYAITFGTDYFSLAPVAGYSYHRQELTMTDGCQTLPDSGPFPGLDSTYKATWQGPWIGVELSVALKKINRYLHAMELCLGAEHHWATYEATADWNLRTDFMHPKSFEHDTNGHGDKFIVGLKNRLSEHTTVGIFYEQQQWTTQRGVDRVFLLSGQEVETRLNEVNWRSNAMRIEMSIAF